MNGHARRRWPQLAVGVAGCVGLVASGVLAWPRLRVGDVDPASLVVGLASLAAAVWPIWQARRQEQDVGSAADRLARTVAVLAGHLARDAGTNIVLHELWPLAGMPVLVDGDVVVPESSTVIEYLDRFGDAPPMIPADPDAALRVRVWDRVMDGNVMTPMQTIVFNALRPQEHKDPFGVDGARATLEALAAT